MAESSELACGDFRIAPGDGVVLLEISFHAIAPVVAEALEVDSAPVCRGKATGIVISVVNARLIYIGGMGDKLGFPFNYVYVRNKLAGL